VLPQQTNTRHIVNITLCGRPGPAHPVLASRNGTHDVTINNGSGSVSHTVHMFTVLDAVIVSVIVSAILHCSFYITRNSIPLIQHHTRLIFLLCFRSILFQSIYVNFCSLIPRYFNSYIWVLSSTSKILYGPFHKG
jgi:hypothetical protein